MPIRYAHDNGILAFTVHGDVEFESGTDILEAGLRSARTAGGSSKWHLLFDIRQSTEHRESDELRDIAACAGSLRCGRPRLQLPHE